GVERGAHTDEACQAEVADGGSVEFDAAEAGGAEVPVQSPAVSVGPANGFGLFEYFFFQVVVVFALGDLRRPYVQGLGFSLNLSEAHVEDGEILRGQDGKFPVLEKDYLSRVRSEGKGIAGNESA